MEGLGMFLNAKFSTAIHKCPNGKYSIVGSVPMSLTKEYVSGFTRGRTSLVWDTEKEVFDALVGIGIRRFQKADCSWHDVDAEKCFYVHSVPDNRWLEVTDDGDYDWGGFQCAKGFVTRKKAKECVKQLGINETTVKVFQWERKKAC